MGMRGPHSAVEFSGTAGLFPEDVVDVLEGLLEPGNLLPLNYRHCTGRSCLVVPTLDLTRVVQGRTSQSTAVRLATLSRRVPSDVGTALMGIVVVFDTQHVIA